MAKKIYYEKVGRRYVPVSEYDSELLDSFPKGAHLVMCYPGGQSRRYNIDPNYAAMIAAGRVAEDAIARAIVRASEGKPAKTPITQQQAEAWQQMKDAFGDELFGIQYSSAWECAQLGVKAMQEQADALMQNDTVREAFETFVAISKLAAYKQG